MEKLNKKTLSFPSPIIAKAIAALTIMLSLVACTGGGGGDTGPVGLVTGCHGCQGIVAPVGIGSFNAESIVMNQWPVQMQNVQLIVDANRYVPASGSSYNNYVGEVAVQGEIWVNQEILSANGACVVPAGRYALQTYAAGFINQGRDFVIPDMVAGPMRLRMGAGSMGFSMLTNQNGVIRWGGQLEIVAVNNITCGGTFFSDMK